MLEINVLQKIKNISIQFLDTFYEVNDEFAISLLT